jgi:hypothetical protein
MYGFRFFVNRTSRSSVQTGQGKAELPFKIDIGSLSFALHTSLWFIVNHYLYVTYKEIGVS